MATFQTETANFTVVVTGGQTITPGTVAAFTVNAQNTTDNAATAQITSKAVGNKTLVLQTITSQTANALEVQANSGSVLYAISAAGLPTTVGGSATAGLGYETVLGYGRSTAQVAAVASVAAYTVGAADGTFIISSNVGITASVTHNFTVTATYTDETNTSRVLTLSFSQLTGVFLTAITNVQGVGAYEGIPLHIRCKAATSITIATTGTFTSVTYNVEGAIVQVA